MQRTSGSRSGVLQWVVVLVVGVLVVTVVLGLNLIPRLNDGQHVLDAAEVAGLLNGYLDVMPIREGIADYITLPKLGSRAGVLGAIALAGTASPQAE
jgi:hypothetical protein